LLLNAPTLSSVWPFSKEGRYAGWTAPGLWAVPSENLAPGQKERQANGKREPLKAWHTWMTRPKQKEHLRFLLLAGATYPNPTTMQLLLTNEQSLLLTSFAVPFAFPQKMLPRRRGAALKTFLLNPIF
jgi:hypothetical protein